MPPHHSFGRLNTSPLLKDGIDTVLVDAGYRGQDRPAACGQYEAIVARLFP